MLAILTTIVGFTAASVTIGRWVDRSLPDDKKRAIAERIRQSFQISAIVTLADNIRFAFDRVFDKKRRGHPSFIRAGLVSCGILTILSLRWIYVYEDRTETVRNVIFRPHKDIEVTLLVVLMLAVFVVFVNWTGDYFSLWETRVVIDRIAAARNWMLQVSWLVFDLVATIVIYWISASCALLFISVTLLGANRFNEIWSVLCQIWSSLWEVFFRGGLTFGHSESSLDPLAIFFHTSLFTSVWAWVLMAGLILSSLIRPLLMHLNWFEEVSQKSPVACLTLVGSFFLGCVFTVLDQFNWFCA